MTWVVFPTKAAWAAFHDPVCASMGIPYPPVSAADGRTRVDAQWVQAAYQPRIVIVTMPDLSIRRMGVCNLPDALITQYGLTALPNPTSVTRVDGMVTSVTITYNAKTYTVQPADGAAVPYMKAKPSSWTDPATGTVHQVG